jgi:saccharopine dehydrogenase (NADP+, L-glutamate forming)
LFDLYSAIENAIQLKAGLSDAKLRTQILEGLRWFGMLSASALVPKRGTMLDALCATFEEKLQYRNGERDMVFLQHRFDVETSKMERKIITATLVEYGTAKASAMAKTVGVPCGIATQLILDGKLSARGVVAPMTPDIVYPLIEALEKEGITMEEVSY